ncbi:MAG: hypothetical protein NWF08_04830 [Candidatus Bathyarchaeota archaeon]|nr:hypothetical protein [Candidatus Bathyarchaeota archaeon]
MNKSKELLKSLGFSDHESEIYLSLLDKPEGESIDSIISTYKIPPEKFEEAIGKLVEKDLVSIKSNIMLANDPTHFLSRIVEEKRNETENLLQEFYDKASILERVLKPIYLEKRLGIKPEELLESIDGLDKMEKRTSKIISEADKEIFVFAEKFDWYEDVQKNFKNALSRGVKAKILMMVIDEYTKKRAKELQELGAEVKHCTEKWYPVRGTMVDNNELIFVIWATKKDVPRPLHYKPHYTRNIGLIRVFSDAFKKRWEEALQIK